MQALESMAQGRPTEITTKQDQGGSFLEMMQQAVNEVNETQAHANDLRKSFELGDGRVDLSEVMVAAQKSRISFQALTEVRNKLLTAYQDVMNMPV